MKSFMTTFGLLVAMSFSTGCCGPMWNCGGCGPGACGPVACGPVACGSGACDTGCDGCGACDGCGELYIDPWVNHPADCCDPCDACGNYNGGSCGQCRSVFAGVKSLWGYRCVDNCGGGACDGGWSESGCQSCGGGGGAVMPGGPMMHESYGTSLPPGHISPGQVASRPAMNRTGRSVAGGSAAHGINPRPSQPIFQARPVSTR